MAEATEKVAPWLEGLRPSERDAIKRLVDEAPPLPQRVIDLIRATNCPIAKGRTKDQAA